MSDFKSGGLKIQDNLAGASYSQKCKEVIKIKQNRKTTHTPTYNDDSMYSGHKSQLKVFTMAKTKAISAIK